MGDDAEIVLVSPTNYFLYLPLLPEVAAGILEPRRISISLADTLPAQVRTMPGEVEEIDLAGRTVRWVDPEGGRQGISYDRLVLAAGSVHNLQPIPGVSDHAHGFRGVPEALYLRDHLIRQIDLAAASDDPAEREARRTFVVVGAGYTGTELAAQGQLFTDMLARSRGMPARSTRWVLVNRSRILSGLDRHCVGVRADPLLASLGLELEKGRVVVGPDLRVPGHPEVFLPRSSPAATT